MSSLNDVQKQLIFDYSLGLTSPEESTEAEALISANEEAARIRAKLRSSLAPLDSLEPQSCPDELVEQTISRLKDSADSSEFRLRQLIAEQAQPAGARVRFWRNWGELVAVAAVIIFLTGILVPPLNFARQKSWQDQCGRQLGNIFQGISQYSLDNDGQLPAIIGRPDTPWCRVGYQGSEDYSNTRSLWRLVKGGYVKNPANFVCPAKSQGRALQFDTSKVQSYNDFPARRYVTYSPRIICTKSQKGLVLGQEPLMADLNPIFENLPQEWSCEIKVRLNNKLLTINSANHRGQGQNILFWDGSVRFIKIRRIGITEDDIFTLREMCPGFEVKGYEVPSCETDIFLAP